ncbi:hypothetical protein LXL04_004009 [Taraxacum kok-saghyz]
MGKKAKKKAIRNAQKEKQFPTASPNTISQKIPTDGGSAVKETIVCPHINAGINLDKVSSKITSLESPKCEDCREGVVDKRSSKSKGKHVKKKGGGTSTSTTSDSKSIWVCLECGQFTCGGVGFPTTPHTHATRHSKLNHHPLAIQLTNPNLRFCFPCNTLIPVQISEENGEQKDAFSSIVKVLKTPPSSEKNSLDVEDIWFGNGSIISEVKVKPVNTQINVENIGGFYIVKGLNNLGNTCFFNSILQNLLAMDKLRDHFLKLETPVGPLSVSLKNLFIKTNPSTFDKNVINPRSLFNAICTLAPHFKGYQQQDSHELLRFLLDGLCNEDRNVPKDNPSFIDSIFRGQICSSVSCLECGHTSIVYEPYLDLSLPLPTKKIPSKKTPLVSKSKNPSPNPPSNRHEHDIIEKTSQMTITESRIPSDDCNGSTTDISSWLDYLDPSSSPNDHDMASENGKIEDCGNGDEVFWEEEAPRVQESEILFLPYKEVSNGNEEMEERETSEFDGFGGLFDEPEPEPESEVISVKNECDSDSDEVDSEVSVDKCLAYFTTSEILNKTDHAWQCEQCSKAFLIEKIRLKNKPQKHVSNGNGNGILSDSVIVSNGIGNGNGNVENGHDANGVEDADVDSTSVKVVRDASKRILISKAPPILTIHLKRLSQDARGRLSKLNGHVDFQDIIYLHPYMDPSKNDGRYRYRLIGVVEHLGSAKGGHYVAYVRGGLRDDWLWYHASDAHVREVSLEETQTTDHGPSPTSNSPIKRLGPRTESDITGKFSVCDFSPRTGSDAKSQTTDRVRHQTDTIKRTDHGPNPLSESESLVRRSIKQPPSINKLQYESPCNNL